MSKLKALVADAVKSVQAEINEKAVVAVAAATEVEAPAAVVTGTSLKSFGADAERLGELGYIIKAVRGSINAKESAELDARFKAIGVTSDIAKLLPSGFTGTMMRDIQAQLKVAALFPYKEVAPGQYDSIALNGITAYMVSEATDGTDSAESYTTMIYLVKKIMARVQKSYEALDDSLINLAEEVRMGVIDSIARAIEAAVVNGDDTATHMDNGVGATSPLKAFKGVRKLALSKGTVDAGGAAMTEADWLEDISKAQELGGLYLDDMQVSAGKVVLLVTQNSYNKLRMLPSFLTRDKAAGNATLFGAAVDSVFGIPVVMSSDIPASVNASGVIDAVSGNNTKTSAVLLNRDYFRFYSTGATLMETDKDISKQSVLFVGSARIGFNGVFDRVDSNPTAVDSARKTAVALINIAK
jgi:HK97 family phage major capsid protein